MDAPDQCHCPHSAFILTCGRLLSYKLLKPGWIALCRQLPIQYTLICVIITPNTWTICYAIHYKRLNFAHTHPNLFIKFKM